MTDGQLLNEFVNGTDPSCFQSLVDRHGPMVMGVCRRVLGDQHEADDAFQSTFMILMNKAPTLREPDRLAEWLRGVAIRVAIRSRRKASRRREREAIAAEQRSQTSYSDSGEHSLKELTRSISEEFDRLPDSYRLPLMLCGLEGMTHEQAASRLGWPLGTVKIRLLRGRKLLKERLKRRGFASASILAAMLWKRPTGAYAAAFEPWASLGLDPTSELPPLDPPTTANPIAGQDPSTSLVKNSFEIETIPDPSQGIGRRRLIHVAFLLVLLCSSVVGIGFAIQSGQRHPRPERSWPAIPIESPKPEPSR